jgi:hypothetical protein
MSLKRMEVLCEFGRCTRHQKATTRRQNHFKTHICPLLKRISALIFGQLPLNMGRVLPDEYNPRLAFSRI